MYWFGSGQKPRSCAVNAKLSSTLGKPACLRRGDVKRPKLSYEYFRYVLHRRTILLKIALYKIKCVIK